MTIVKTLHKQGSTSFSGLMKVAESDAGKLGFHLKQLADLVEQDAGGNYVLSEGGRLAVKVLEAMGLIRTEPPKDNGLRCRGKRHQPFDQVSYGT